MKRFVKLLILFLLLLALPFGVFAAAVHTKENPYHNNFTASLVDKYERLETLPGARLILIGGSSLPFGIRSAMLEEAFGLPAADLGVYAALGTRVMAEIALPRLHAGDVVILAPEVDPQTYSNYFNPDVLWEAACENSSLLRGLSLSEKEEMAFRWFKFAWERKKREGQSIPDGTLYARSSFDAYGDIDFPRTENIMAGGFDASQPVSLSGLKNEDFFAFVRGFVRAAEKKGARVFFAFSPINEKAVRYTAAEAAELEAYLEAQLPGRVLGRLADTTYAAEFFYNTNYHLSEAGAAQHTETLIRLMREAGIFPGGEQPPETLPPASESESPALPTEPSLTEPESTPPASEPLPYDENERFVNIREMGGSLYVSSLSEEGKALETLTLPESYEGRPVIGISEDAFAGSRLKELRIPGCYRIFASFIFTDCPQLKTIVLGLQVPSASSIPMDGLFDGCAEDLKVFVPAESYSAYLSDYNWRRYREVLISE